MRTSDFRLNVCQVLTAAKSQKVERNRLLAKFNRRGVRSKGSEHDRNNWVSFEDGVFLCQAIELEDKFRTFVFIAISLVSVGV